MLLTRVPRGAWHTPAVSLGRCVSLALAVLIAAPTARAQTPVPVPVDDPKPRPVPVEQDPKPRPVPVDDPKPRPVPVAPGSPPPTNDRGPYPVPVTPEEKPPSPSPSPSPTPPPAPAPVAPTTPGTAPPAQPPPPATKITDPATKPATPPPTTPSKPPPVAPVLPPAAPVKVTPDPYPITTTTVDQFEQTPLVGAAPIKSIVVDQNTKTDDATVIVIADIDVGDMWTAEMADVVKSNLVTSGLFKDVEVFWSTVKGGVRVHLLVKDKHSWVIAPAFYNQPTNTGGGVGFGENNLFGLNQKLLVYGQIATGETFFVGAWVIPSIAGSRFSAQFDTYLKQARLFEFAPATAYLDSPERVRESRMNYLNNAVKLGVELWRGVRIETRLRAAKVSFPETSLFSDDPALQYVGEGDPLTDLGPNGIDADGQLAKPGAEGWDVSNEWALSIDRRANWYGIATGHRYAFSFERGVPGLGSDFSYWSLGGSYYRAWKLLERHNFVVRGEARYGHNLPFQQELFIGGTSMRGYLGGQFRGNVKALANLEYSVPLISIKGFSIRGLAFFDSGYAAFTKTSNPQRNYLPGSRRDEQPFLAPFKNSVGIGTRLYLRQIVLPLLGLDVGYGLEARDLQVYLAIGLTD